MDARAAFMRAICEAPDDDMPRLVFADWLDENGDADDAARAALTRTQCELAECGPCPATIFHPDLDMPREHPRRRGGPPILREKKPCGWCPVCKLRERERELWGSQKITGWTCDTHTVGRVNLWWPDGDEVSVSGTVRRGFVDKIEIEPDEWLRVHRLITWGDDPCATCGTRGRVDETANGFTICPDCDGAGRVPWTESEPCQMCNGSKQVPDQFHSGVYLCPECDQTGLSGDEVLVPFPAWAQPITQVRLVRWPEVAIFQHTSSLRWWCRWRNGEFPDEVWLSREEAGRAVPTREDVIVRRLLNRRWPRVAFELPPYERR